MLIVIKMVIKQTITSRFLNFISLLELCFPDAEIPLTSDAAASSSAIFEDENIIGTNKYSIVKNGFLIEINPLNLNESIISLNSLLTTGKNLIMKISGKATFL